MMPMVASDGPHYGDNVKLKGPGKYKVKFIIYPPSAKENTAGNHFGRHTDRATGVRPWFKAVEAEWEFTQSIRMMRQLMGNRMYPLTLEGLDRAMATPRVSAETVDLASGPPAGIKCRECGYTNDPTAAFCGVCGVDLS